MSNSNKKEWVIGKYRVSEENVNKALSNGLTKLDVQVRLEDKNYSIERAVSQSKRKVKNTRALLSYMCEECVLVFQIYAIKPLPRYYCPSCGEYYDVKKYESVKKDKSEETLWLKWKKEEEEVIEKVLDGEIATHQAVLILGRSAYSVRMKIKRMKAKRKGAR